MDATDREAVRTIVVVRRRDADIVEEVQAVRVVTVRRSRPIVAGVADIVETARVVDAITRSRIPDGRCAAELAGEVHAFVSAIVAIFKI